MVDVVLADSHPVFRQGLSRALDACSDLEVAGTAATGEEGIVLIRRLRPHVLVLDTPLDGLDAITVLRTVRSEGAGTRSLVVSSDLRVETVHSAVAAGASGYLPKSSDAEAICDAAKRVAAGEIVWTQEVQAALAFAVRTRDVAGDAELSPRELEILKLVAEGSSTGEIARRLFLSPPTIKTHLHRAFRKLGVGDRAAAVAEALRRGMFA